MNTAECRTLGGYGSALATPEASESVRIFGVDIANPGLEAALSALEACLEARDGRNRLLFFANAHTLNLANSRPWYKDLLNNADLLLGDGTGVRWAARLRGVRMKANLNGTDLMPALLRRTEGRGYRLFLLGAAPAVVERAAAHVAAHFPGWTVAGFHHGYLDAAGGLVAHINRVRPNLLLVGMGNPRQEEWLAAHRSQLAVPLSVGVGGLFDFWAGVVQRAPLWMRRRGIEWVWRLCQEPRGKGVRYLIGNPLFLMRMVALLRQDARPLSPALS